MISDFEMAKPRFMSETQSIASLQPRSILI